MKRKKYVMMGGFAFADNSDMKRLKKLAKEGWVLSGSTFLSYRFEKGEPQDLDFTVDYRDELDADYLMTYEKSGWKHVMSIANVHIFSAKEGTAPIYADKDSKAEILKAQEKSFKKPAIIAILLLIAALIADFSFIPETGWINFLWTMVITLLIIATVFNVMPWLAYKIRRRRLEKQLD